MVQDLTHRIYLLQGPERQNFSLLIFVFFSGLNDFFAGMNDFFAGMNDFFAGMNDFFAGLNDFFAGLNDFFAGMNYVVFSLVYYWLTYYILMKI